MKNIKLFEEFNSHFNSFGEYKSTRFIDDMCSKYGIKNYTVNKDGTIDVEGDVNMSSSLIFDFPLKFNKVSGNFNISNNILNSLIGCPKEVGGDFSCSVNRLTSLEGGPKEVGGNFNCTGNEIENFEGAPIKIGKFFQCHVNPVITIWSLFSNYKHVDLFNDLDPIRDNKVIILDRLNEFLDMIGKPKVTSVKGYTCI